MAAKKISLIKLKIDLEGLKDFKGLTKQLTDLNTKLTPTRSNLKSLAQSIKEVSNVTPKTIGQFKQKDKVLKRLREEVNISGRAYKRLGKEIDANAAKLKSFTQIQPKGMFVFLKLFNMFRESFNFVCKQSNLDFGRSGIFIVHY